ncbi:hypothetical protein O4H52_04400 [Sphingomonadaceae bacterium G21617-S1]|uniref:hypothetical protein n=1 Tax=Rhizorhabdus sp. TaxID=1968843 RepID=UPI0022BC932B|nr:hypothetical protein [Rhizorhabdus sp.]MCZ4340832.1 hypothetical protein [Sphingomonadaceae bacterium G21617-S1]
MRHWHSFDRPVAMASRWRRRRVCQLIGDEGRQSVALRSIDGRGAWLDSDHPHALGSIVELHHPEAGSIRATVSEIGLGSIRISFDGAEQAIAYALSAITSDMTRS